MTHDPLSEMLATLVSLAALWAFVRWPLRSLRRDLAREGRRRAPRRRGGRPRRPHIV